MKDIAPLIPQLRQRLGALGEVEKELRGNGVRALLARTVQERAVVVPPVRAPAPPRLALNTGEAEQLVTAGRQGLQKLQQEGDSAPLTPEELVGLEAIILLVGRPAIFVNGGDFASPAGPWRSVLEQERESIRRVFQSVGRIEVSFGVGEPEMLGTGFLVAPGVVMTNRHVASSFCELRQGTWQFMPGLTPSIDFQGERDTPRGEGRELLEVIGIHDSPEIDLALLRVPQQGADPEPLTLASEVPDALAGREVYVVGYPATDVQGLTPPQVLQDIFGSVYEVKRLQPGKVMDVDLAQPLFSHDCSTLGGNSGSCVVDLQTGQVIGLHFRGSYRHSNEAVALWRLRDDPLLKRAEVRFDRIAP